MRDSAMRLNVLADNGWQNAAHCLCHYIYYTTAVVGNPFLADTRLMQTEWLKLRRARVHDCYYQLHAH